MSIPFKRRLLGLGLASLVALPAAAFAQDSDGDGALNAADAFPCDATRASVSFFPGQSTSALLAFEDQWPAHTDVDYNDVAVRAHYRLERNAAGNVVQLAAVFDPVALGGDFSNGLGLVLPTSRTGVSVRRRVGGGAWQTVTLEADANATMVLSANLRELFANASGRINSRANEARQSGQRLEVEVTFATPAAISQAAAPFDTFIFRSGNLAHQIHFPQYSGTAAMNAALFNSDQDGSSANRRFVHVSGVPAALNLMTSTRYPLEGVGISALFPDIAGFAASGGSQNASFYSTNVVSAEGHDVAAIALPAVAAADTACTALGTTAGTPGTSCDTLRQAGVTTSGVYWLDPDGAGPNASFQGYCDMTADGGGWLLAGKVNTADVQLGEPRTWFTSTTNASDVLSPTMTKNAGMASLGTARLLPLIGASTLARVVVVAEDDPNQTARWFKRVASTTSFSAWFNTDTTASTVCTNLAMTTGCVSGIIGRSGEVTTLGGMNLASFGYASGGELHMRLDGDVAPSYTAVCSVTYNYNGNAWNDNAADGHWGNGLLVWIR